MKYIIHAANILFYSTNILLLVISYLLGENSLTMSIIRSSCILAMMVVFYGEVYVPNRTKFILCLLRLISFIVYCFRLMKMSKAPIKSNMVSKHIMAFYTLNDKQYMVILPYSSGLAAKALEITVLSEHENESGTGAVIRCDITQQPGTMYNFKLSDIPATSIIVSHPDKEELIITSTDILVQGEIDKWLMT